MSSFNEMLQELVNEDDDYKIKLAAECLSDLYPTFKRFDPEHEGMLIIYTLFGTSAAADGQLTEKELGLITGLLAAVGINHEPEEIIDLVKTCGNSDAYQMIGDVREHLDDEGANNLLNLIAAICSIDDRIAKEEVAFIKDLL